MKWKAALFLDGTDRPAAQTILVNDYRKNGGLKPGSRFHIRFPIWFVRGTEAWTTLEIRNAEVRKVVLEPILESILAFGARRLEARRVGKEVGSPCSFVCWPNP